MIVIQELILMRSLIIGGVHIVLAKEVKEREESQIDINQICKCFYACVFWEGVLEVL